MCGSFYYTPFGPKLRFVRPFTESRYARTYVGGASTFPCEKTGEMVDLSDCMRCEEYRVFDEEDDLRSCQYKSPEQLESEAENRRKNEEEIRRNEEFNMRMQEEMEQMREKRKKDPEAETQYDHDSLLDEEFRKMFKEKGLFSTVNAEEENEEEDDENDDERNVKQDNEDEDEDEEEIDEDSNDDGDEDEPFDQDWLYD